MPVSSSSNTTDDDETAMATHALAGSASSSSRPTSGVLSFTPLGGSPGGNFKKLWTASVVSNFGDGLTLVAYPWLASAVTRDPVAIGAVTVTRFLPWLLLSLPAGVLTDRVDRRRLVVLMDAIRFVVTSAVAVAVMLAADGLPSPDEVAAGALAEQHRVLLLGMLYVAGCLLGAAEVLRDNSAQTLLPAIVPSEHLERANGRLYSAELIMNSFVGPPVAGLLLGVAFGLPFLVDAATFGLAAALVALLVGEFRPVRQSPVIGGTESRASWRVELMEGLRWLWSHRLLRALAISLGGLNLLALVEGAVYVLFAQEVLDVGPTGYGLLALGTAGGGVLGAMFAAPLSGRLGTGPSLQLTVAVSAAAPLAIFLWPDPFVYFVAMAMVTFVGVVWNVITVAFRQAIIPDHLLGRVNSVYRFIGWGVMPIGSLLGGAIVAWTGSGASRDTALRMPWLVAAVGHALLLVYVGPRLTSAAMARARADAAPAVADG
jgi:MFS family permease